VVLFRLVPEGFTNRELRAVFEQLEVAMDAKLAA